MAAASRPLLEMRSPETAQQQPPVAVQSLAASKPMELQALEVEQQPPVAPRSLAASTVSDGWSEDVESKPPTTPACSPKTPESNGTTEGADNDNAFEEGVLLETCEGGRPSPNTLRAFAEKKQEKKQAFASQKFTTLEQVESETLLRKGSARSDGNNCLLFATALVTDMLHPSTQADPAAIDAVQHWRARQLCRLLKKLQVEAPDAGAAQWDAGWSCSLAQQGFDNTDFLGQIHIFDVAEETNNIMVVLQRASEQSTFISGGDRLIANVYFPGYGALCEDVDKVEVLKLLQREEGDVRVLIVEGGHFSPLLNAAQCNASLFAPCKLLSAPAEGVVEGTEGAEDAAKGPSVPSTDAEEEALLAKTLAASRRESTAQSERPTAPPGVALMRASCSELLIHSFGGKCPEGYEMEKNPDGMGKLLGGGLFGDPAAAWLSMLGGTVLVPLEIRKAEQPLQLLQLVDNWPCEQTLAKTLPGYGMALGYQLEEQRGLKEGMRVYVPQGKPELLDLSCMAAVRGVLVQRQRGPDGRDEQHVDARLIAYFDATFNAVQLLTDEYEAEAVTAQFYCTEGGDKQPPVGASSSTEDAPKATTADAMSTPATPLHHGTTGTAATTTMPQAAAVMPVEGMHVLVGEPQPMAGLCFIAKPEKGYFGIAFENGSYSGYGAGTQFQPCPEEQHVSVGGVVVRSVAIEQPNGAKPLIQAIPEAFLYDKNSINGWEVFDTYQPPSPNIRAGGTFAEPRLPPLKAGNRVDCIGNVCSVGSGNIAASGKAVIFVGIAQQRLKVATGLKIRRFAIVALPDNNEELTWADCLGHQEGYISLRQDLEDVAVEELSSLKAKLPKLLAINAAAVNTRLARVVDTNGMTVTKVNLRPRPKIGEAAGGVAEGGERGGGKDGGNSGGSGGSSGGGSGGEGDGKGKGKGDGNKSKVAGLFIQILHCILCEHCITLTLSGGQPSGKAESYARPERR